ncbi:replication-associated protein [Blackfly DNA virus 19]|nr:replication-associated protein [Blackfly DNA virus 19]
MSAFRLSAKNISLTYAQVVTFTKEELFEHLLSLDPAFLIVSQETHKDGGLHFHCLFTGTRKLEIKNPRYFDFRGAHPNTQGTRNKRAWLEYLKKEDGQPLQFGTDSTEKRSWADTLGAETREEFLDMVKSVSPRDWILQNDRITSFADKIYSRKEDYKPLWTQFHITSRMQLWESQRKNSVCNRLDRPKSLFVQGPSRTGKTEWARSLGKHMYWNGMIDITNWDDEAEYAIFDDFEYQYIPNKKGFFGSQKEFTLTDKYRKKKTVKWGKPCIYLYNEDMNPLSKLSTTEVDWLSENVIFTEFLNKLYS